MLKFDKQVANICREVSQQGAVLKRMRNILPFYIWKNKNMSFIFPHFDYCAQTCETPGMRIPLLGGYRSSKELADLWREYLLSSVV